MLNRSEHGSDHKVTTEQNKHSERLSGLIAGFIAVAIAAAPVLQADARPRPRAKKFVTNKTVGIGFMLGAPTGFAGKYYLSSSTAVDFGLGLIRVPGPDGFHIHGDFLWHPAVLATTPPFILPIYFGLGGRLFAYDDPDDEVALGLRVPGGIMLDFNNVPVDVFFELVFVLDFVSEGDLEPRFNGAVGARYYF
ncbi:MAG: hypothetical protein MJE77_22470 [Proteobacteria bacterium]|nr:hypothetical protein [Pseudomonadota bacterium]